MPQKKIPVAILGATGYTGGELVRLLITHPHVNIAVVTSRQYAGESYAKAFPAFTGLTDLVCEELDVDAIATRAEFVFSCLPHRQSAEVVAALVKKGLKVADLSADFRIKDVAVYEKAYGPHPAPALLKRAAYGLPELYRAKIKRAQLVAGPGCYPTSVLLGLAPALKKKLMTRGPIIADCKSGVTGAGRGLHQGVHFCEVNEGMYPYKLLEHRHAPEIDQEVSRLAGAPTSVDFVPHLIPVNRGILSTLYVTLKDAMTREQLLAVYARFYKNEPFVLVRDDEPRVQDVRASNYAHIGVAVKGKRAVIVSAIDNLTKGASGQLVQCMNLMQGWDETTGLVAPPAQV